MWCTSLLNHLKEEEKIPAFPVYQHKAWPHHVSGTWQSPAPIHIFQCIQSQNLNNFFAKAFFLQRHQIKSKFSSIFLWISISWNVDLTMYPCHVLRGEAASSSYSYFPRHSQTFKRVKQKQTILEKAPFSWRKKTWTFKSLEYLAARKFMSFSSDCLELFICTMFHYQLW